MARAMPARSSIRGGENKKRERKEASRVKGSSKERSGGDQLRWGENKGGRKEGKRGERKREGKRKGRAQCMSQLRRHNAYYKHRFSALHPH